MAAKKLNKTFKFVPAFGLHRTRSDDALTSWTDYIYAKFDDDSAKILVAVDDKIVVGYIGAMIRMYPPVWTITKYGFIDNTETLIKKY